MEKTKHSKMSIFIAILISVYGIWYLSLIFVGSSGREVAVIFSTILAGYICYNYFKK